MLRYSKEKLAEERSITDIYFKAQRELDVRKELYEKFRRKLTDEELASLDDEDIKVPLERYISIMSAGYFGGKAPTYKVKAFNADKDKIIKELFNHNTNDEQEIKEIEELIKHIVDYNNDGSHFLHLVLDYLVKRACYEIYYKDEITGLTTADGKRYYYDTPKKRKMFGTPAYEQNYKDEPLFKENIEEKQPKKWDDDIPATAIENCDGMAIFEPVISLIRAYERCIQNSRNVFKYNDEAILKVIGYQPENPLIIQNEKGEDIINPAREKEDEYVLTSRVRYLDGSKEVNSDIAWVEKNVNDTALQNHKKTLMDIICLCSFCPNMTDLGFTQADNNSALEKKFFGLQQYVSTFEGDFLEGFKRRWRIILEKFNKEKSKTYDFRDIEIKLNRNLPSDTATMITNAMKIRGLVSDDTVINLLGLDLDSTSELAKMDLQNEENIQKNLEQMQMMGQAGVKQNNQQEENKDDKVTDLTDQQKAQKLTADNKKEQTKVVNKQINKE